MTKSTQVQNEIESQPDAWQGILLQYLRKQLLYNKQITKVASGEMVFTGCGTTYALALSAANLFSHFGFSARAYPASEVKFYPENTLPAGSALFALSRSGETSETLWAVESYRKKNPAGIVFTLTTQPASTLANRSDIVFDLSLLKEESIAETRSFTGMLYFLQLLRAGAQKDKNSITDLSTLPGHLARLMEVFSDWGHRVLAEKSIDYFVFLGEGMAYGLACESMFKMHELTTCWSQAFHPLEFRHGPQAVVGPSTLVVGFLSDRLQKHELKQLEELGFLGAKTVAVIDHISGEIPGHIDQLFELQTDLDEWHRGGLYLPFVHWLGLEKASLLGINPDQPKNLKAFTCL